MHDADELRCLPAGAQRAGGGSRGDAGAATVAEPLAGGQVGDAVALLMGSHAAATPLAQEHLVPAAALTSLILASTKEYATCHHNRGSEGPIFGKSVVTGESLFRHVVSDDTFWGVGAETSTRNMKQEANVKHNLIQMHSSKQAGDQSGKRHVKQRLVCLEGREQGGETGGCSL